MTDYNVPDEPETFFDQVKDFLGEGKGYKELAKKNKKLAKKMHVELCRMMIAFYIKGYQAYMTPALEACDTDTAEKILLNSTALLTVALSLMGDADNIDPRFFPWEEAAEKPSPTETFENALKALYKNHNN